MEKILNEITILSSEAQGWRTRKFVFKTASQDYFKVMPDVVNWTRGLSVVSCQQDQLLPKCMLSLWLRYKLPGHGMSQIIYARYPTINIPSEPVLDQPYRSLHHWCTCSDFIVIVLWVQFLRYERRKYLNIFPTQHGLLIKYMLLTAMHGANRKIRLMKH